MGFMSWKCNQRVKLPQPGVHQVHERLDWVVKGRQFHRVSSTEIFHGEYQQFLRGTKSMTFFLSPHGQFFFVDEDDGTIELINKRKMTEWLEKFNAPSAAYRSAGIELQDG